MEELLQLVTPSKDCDAHYANNAQDDIKGDHLLICPGSFAVFAGLRSRVQVKIIFAQTTQRAKTSPETQRVTCCCVTHAVLRVRTLIHAVRVFGEPIPAALDTQALDGYSVLVADHAAFAPNAVAGGVHEVAVDAEIA